MLKKYFLEGSYTGKGDNPESLTLNSGKVADFIQTFRSLVGFYAFSIKYLNF